MGWLTRNDRRRWALACTLAAGLVASGSSDGQSRKPVTRSVPSNQEKGRAMAMDAKEKGDFAAFLRAYHQAVKNADTTFLTAHTLLPLPFAQGTYQLEAKAQKLKFGTVGELLKAKEVLLWPENLLPKTAADLAQMKSGKQKCGDAASPEIPDWMQVEPAFQVQATAATLTYLSNPCESETHRVTLHFMKGESGWKLTERSVKMGTGAAKTAL